MKFSILTKTLLSLMTVASLATTAQANGLSYGNVSQLRNYCDVDNPGSFVSVYDAMKAARKAMTTFGGSVDDDCTPHFPAYLAFVVDVATKSPAQGNYDAITGWIQQLEADKYIGSAKARFYLNSYFSTAVESLVAYENGGNIVNRVAEAASNLCGYANRQAFDLQLDEEREMKRKGLYLIDQTSGSDVDYREAVENISVAKRMTDLTCKNQ